MNDIIKKEGTQTPALKKPGVLDINSLRKKKMEIMPFQMETKKSTTAGLQLLMMFDITVSMFGYFNKVREELTEISNTIKSEVIDSEIAIFAFRNHNDERHYEQIYYTSPLSSNSEEIYRAIKSIKKGGGGFDSLTCMEDCLNEANKLAWLSKAPKAIVIIGDQPPHGVVDSIKKCPRQINYRDEVQLIKDKGIKIYPVFCGTKNRVKDFYLWLAEFTGGKFLEIDNIDLLKDLLIAISLKEAGKLDKYIEGLRQNKSLGTKTEKALLMLK